ncbi:MAG: Crp/Fnr family transcriptional regulator [Bacteroidales bacterium]|nr:Crp/Fnr family transcriptional regulator [Bacteroidales bacterium]
MSKENTSVNKWEKFRPLFDQLEVPARTTLLAEGEISRTMYFVEKGCLRTWVNNDGKEITTRFFFEGDSVSSIESFMTNQASLYSIESLEPCTLLTLSQERFKNAIANSAELKMDFETHLFNRLLQAQKHFYSFLKNNPQQRYEDLLEKYPHIIHRVPQHYIASYLGITSVSLSRIRKRLLK